MLQINDIERIAYIQNNIPALQLCTELDDVQADLLEAESRIKSLEAQVNGLEEDVMMLELGYQTNGTKQDEPANDHQIERLAALEKMISRTVFNLRENGRLTKKQQSNLADFLEKF